MDLLPAQDPDSRTAALEPAGAPPLERALVLGGGGSTGNAWLIGVLAGLLDAGVDVTAPDLTVGTSAGATAAAQLAAASPSDLLTAALAPVPPHLARPGGGGGGPAGGVPAGVGPVTDHLDRLRRMVAEAEDAADLRRRIGAAALEREAASDGTWRERWRAVVAARLPGSHWPERRLLLTAVDAATGEPVVLDRDSGVDLVDAVAASCSSGLPYRVAGRPLLDGGYRANAENADLAAGYARVLVLAPFGGAALASADWTTPLATQVDALRAGGSRVGVVAPDGAHAHLFGAHAMDWSLRPLAARAGHDQGLALAQTVSDLWR